MNLGSFSGGGQGTGVSGGGTLNIANSNLTISGVTSGFDIFGAVTVGTGNLLPLNSPNTLVNAGAIVITTQTGGIGVGGFPCPPPLPCDFIVFPGGTYNEVIGGPNSFGTLTVTPPPSLSFLPISLAGTLRITLADSYVPPVGQTFTIMTAVGDGLAGTFSNIEGQTFNNGTEIWDLDYIFDQRTQLSKVELVAVPAVPEPSFFGLAGLGLLGIVWAHRLSRSPAPGSRPSRGI
jgi:hypothetical protein